MPPFLWKRTPLIHFFVFIFFVISGAAQTIENAPATLVGAGAGSPNMGQSFTATVSGYIVNIQVVNNDVASTNLRIYAGEGNGGTLLHTQEVDLTDTYTNTTTFTFQTIVLDKTVGITSGSKYTFLFDTGAPGIQSPGTYAGGDYINNGAALAGIDSPFRVEQAEAIVWDGSSNSLWNTGSNWAGDAVPTSSDNVVIPNVGVNPDISDVAATTNNLTIDPSVSVGVSGSAASLTVSGNLVNNGEMSVSNGSSLIVSGSSTGNIKYTRNVGSTNWYLISSPVGGLSIVDFRSVNAISLGSGSGVNQNIAIAPYNNNGATASDRWSYYSVGQTDGINGDDTSDMLDSGKGFIVKPAIAAQIEYTGTMPTSDIGMPISVGTANAFNAIGNPYPSYIPANNSADGTNNILKVNDTDNDYLSESTLWFWDQGSDNYIAINHASPARFIAPDQGFFVSANGSHTFSFTEAMQSHQSTEVFNRSSSTSRPEIQLEVTNGTTTKKADIFYISGTTIGWDDGYDSTIFAGTSDSFLLYTHLVGDSQGQKLAIQSLPDAGYENMVIPIGVHAELDTQVTFRLDAINIPDNLNVYLEDRINNTFAQLDIANAEYVITADSNTTGVGRFYLHTNTQQVLSTGSYSLENISIYADNNDMLNIVGLEREMNAELRIYSILGRELYKKTFVTLEENSIDVSSLKTGVYIVDLNTDKGKLSKKVIIN